MKYYDINTAFTFGKYAGRTLISIATADPEYLDWCSINLDHFYINEQNLKLLSQSPINIKLSEEALAALNKKKLIDDQRKEERRKELLSDDQDDNYYNDRHTYDRYNGSYAQEMEGYSDQDIDDLFDGDPSAYWNID